MNSTRLHNFSPVRRTPAWIAPVLVAGALAILMPEAVYAAAAEGESESIWITIARLTNFAILVGALVYFLKSPLMGYLLSRSTQIRQDLVNANELRASATAQLAEIERKRATLPAELEALTRQGEEDLRAEQARIAQAAVAERDRLLEQMRREIDMRLRVARRDLTEHAARLAIGIAEERIKRSITPDDQVRLIDRYAAQLQGVAQ
jgi:F-type H+-transporting ATPase subunit b